MQLGVYGVTSRTQLMLDELLDICVQILSLWKLGLRE